MTKSRHVRVHLSRYNLSYILTRIVLICIWTLVQVLDQTAQPLQTLSVVVVTDFPIVLVSYVVEIVQAAIGPFATLAPSQDVPRVPLRNALRYRSALIIKPFVDQASLAHRRQQECLTDFLSSQSFSSSAVEAWSSQSAAWSVVFILASSSSKVRGGPGSTPEGQSSAHSKCKCVTLSGGQDTWATVKQTYTAAMRVSILCILLEYIVVVYCAEEDRTSIDNSHSRLLVRFVAKPKLRQFAPLVYQRHGSGYSKLKFLVIPRSSNQPARPGSKALERDVAKRRVVTGAPTSQSQLRYQPEAGNGPS